MDPSMIWMEWMESIASAIDESEVVIAWEGLLDEREIVIQMVIEIPSMLNQKLSVKSIVSGNGDQISKGVAWPTRVSFDVAIRERRDAETD